MESLRHILSILLSITLVCALFIRGAKARVKILLAGADQKQAAANQAVAKRVLQRGRIETTYAQQMLDAVMQKAREIDIRPFLVSGTLLGFHREGQLLEHDYDLDVGVDVDDAKLPAFLKALEQIDGYSHTKEVGLNKLELLLNPWLTPFQNMPLIYKIYFKRDIDDSKGFALDVFLHANINGFSAHGSFRTMWINRPFETVKREFDGRQYWVPENTDQYLRENYGDYTVKQVYFENATDCPNAMNVVGFRSALWQAGRYNFFLKSNDEHRRNIMWRRIKEMLNPISVFKLASQWSIGKFRDDV
jgi:hypothetical protein